MAKDDGRCGRCRSTNLAVESIRDIRRPARKGDPPDADRPVLARKVEVRCRRCGWTDCIVRRVR